MIELRLGEGTCDVLKNLFMEFRRVQVSRFPLIVESREGVPNWIRVTDSRFPTDSWHKKHLVVGFLRTDGTDEKGKQIFALQSRLIRNERYVPHNNKYSTKATTDPKRMLRLMKDYLRPFTPEEIRGSCEDLNSSAEEWRREPSREYLNLARELSPAVLAEEVLYLRSIGVKFKSSTFEELSRRGVDLYEEGVRRKDQWRYSLHVYVQPDQSVIVSSDNNSIEWTFPSMEQAPPVVQQQVAMLKMIEPNTYVPGVGRMVDPKMYWIHVEKDVIYPTATKTNA